MSPRKTILAAAFAVVLNAGIAAAPAAAQTVDSVTVSYADLNLGSAAGRAVLDRRIAHAARQVCGQFAPIELRRNSLSRACQADVIASAEAQRSAIVFASNNANARVSRTAY